MGFPQPDLELVFTREPLPDEVGALIAQHMSTVLPVVGSNGVQAQSRREGPRLGPVRPP